MTLDACARCGRTAPDGNADDFFAAELEYPDGSEGVLCGDCLALEEREAGEREQEAADREKEDEGPYWIDWNWREPPDEGRSALEWISYLAGGEPLAEFPQCVSGELRSYCAHLNDALEGRERQLLRPYLARFIGTDADGRSEERTRLLTTWLVGTAVPDLLEEIRCPEAAWRVRSGADDLSAAQEAMRVLDREAERVAWSARSPGKRPRWRLFTLSHLEITDAKELLGVASKRQTCAVESAAHALGVLPGDAGDIPFSERYAEAFAVWVLRDLGSPALVHGCHEAAEAALDARYQRSVRDALALLDELLPPEPLRTPVADDWRDVCRP